MSITFKVTKAGTIACYRNRQRLHALWAELPLPAGPARAALRVQLDPVLVRATRLLFGPAFTPANFNEVYQRRVMVHQVMRDAPRVLVPIYFFVQQVKLAEKPHATIVRRFKDTLQRVGAQDYMRVGQGARPSTDSKGRPRKENHINLFWSSYLYFEEPALSEAGWRYLLKLSAPTLRQLSRLVWQWPDRWLRIFNVLGLQNLPPLPFPALELLNQPTRTAGCFRNLARSVAGRFADGLGPFGAREITLVRDWLNEEDRRIGAGRQWETMLEEARAEDGAKAEKILEERAVYEWTPPILPFIGEAGLAVVPLSTGVELWEEGKVLRNCLEYRTLYARRAVEGLSQVFSIQGIAGRATAEFVRSTPASPWHLAQVEAPQGETVNTPVINRVVAQIQQKLQGGV